MINPISWILSSPARFILAGGSIIGVFFTITFLAMAKDADQLTKDTAVFFTFISAVSGIFWATVIWFAVLTPLRKLLLKSNSSKRTP